MKKLFHQMMKFGLVGVICFVIDYITGLIVLNVLMALFTDAWFEKASMIGSAAGFIVSVNINCIHINRDCFNDCILCIAD